MKKFFGILLLATSICACKSSKQTNTTTYMSNMKGNLLDGTWEANYMLTTGTKSFGDLFPKTKPSMTFNFYQSEVSGITGCNSFSGNFTIDGSKIQFGDNMAVSKKMCIDGLDGETAFLETLKKVNKWSVTDKNTLNLIMGDMAIMRLAKKQ